MGKADEGAQTVVHRVASDERADALAELQETFGSEVGESLIRSGATDFVLFADPALGHELAAGAAPAGGDEPTKLRVKLFGRSAP